MHMLIEMCCVCLANTNKLREIDILDIDNIKIERKLEYCTAKYKNIRPAIPLYICSKCCRKLRIAYEFKKSYYRSCRILKGYVSQLKRNKSCYAGNNQQKELQVKITNLGECMIDGTFSKDIVIIENVETQFIGIVPDSTTPDIVTDITNIETTVTDTIENNSVNENVSLVFNHDEHLDIDDVKISADSVKSEEANVAETVNNKDDVNTSEEKEDECKIWIGNVNGNTFINFASSIMQQSVEIIQENDLDNEESNHLRIDSEMEDKLQLNLVLEGIAKSEDTGDICKIWVENTNNRITDSSTIVNESANLKVENTNNNNHSENITDNVSSIFINKSADIKEENLILDGTSKSEDTMDVCKIWVVNTNNDGPGNITNPGPSITTTESADIKNEMTVPDNIENTDNACVKRKRKLQSNRKKMKYSSMLTESSSDMLENNNIPKCMQCNELVTYKNDLLSYLIAHSGNKPFCSTLCREQYDGMS